MWHWLSAGLALAGTPDAELMTSWQTYQAHASFKLPTPDEKQRKQLLAGKVVKLVERRHGAPSTAIALMLTDHPLFEEEDLLAAKLVQAYREWERTSAHNLAAYSRQRIVALRAAVQDQELRFKEIVGSGDLYATGDRADQVERRDEIRRDESKEK